MCKSTRDAAFLELMREFHDQYPPGFIAVVAFAWAIRQTAGKLPVVEISRFANQYPRAVFVQALEITEDCVADIPADLAPWIERAAEVIRQHFL